ncbi:hypothetical protein BP6252_05997 [Coleophoma cylindrospora]|uniref:DUF7704 domain-containing protein n=1 Tax=Coleophoma cylindrospora TaxID=1849047 RepID=A0A3D8RLC8_9HELO|nr:hypothetical protein BP6252_05997 [Coleophoma cylindrospora]
MASPIKPLYYYWFTIVDPILAVIAILSSLFDPASLLLSLTPRATLPRPEVSILLAALAGAYACLLVLHWFVLRPRPNDVALWKSVQAGQALFEAAKLAGVCWAISIGEGVSTQVWINIGITASLIVFRIGFLLDMGNGKAKSI